MLGLQNDNDLASWIILKAAILSEAWFFQHTIGAPSLEDGDEQCVNWFCGGEVERAY